MHSWSFDLLHFDAELVFADFRMWDRLYYETSVRLCGALRVAGVEVGAAKRSVLKNRTNLASGHVKMTIEYSNG